MKVIKSTSSGLTEPTVQTLYNKYVSPHCAPRTALERGTARVYPMEFPFECKKEMKDSLSGKSCEEKA